MHRVDGLVAHADGHDDLVVAIHGGLGVVALNPAVSAFEDVAVGIGEIALGLWFGIPSCIRRELTVWHRQ